MFGIFLFFRFSTPVSFKGPLLIRFFSTAFRPPAVEKKFTLEYPDKSEDELRALEGDPAVLSRLRAEALRKAEDREVVRPYKRFNRRYAKQRVFFTEGYVPFLSFFPYALESNLHADDSGNVLVSDYRAYTLPAMFHFFRTYVYLCLHNYGNFFEISDFKAFDRKKFYHRDLLLAAFYYFPPFDFLFSLKPYIWFRRLGFWFRRLYVPLWVWNCSRIVYGVGKSKRREIFEREEDPLATILEMHRRLSWVKRAIRFFLISAVTLFSFSSFGLLLFFSLYVPVYFVVHLGISIFKILKATFFSLSFFYYGYTSNPARNSEIELLARGQSPDPEIRPVFPLPDDYSASDQLALLWPWRKLRTLHPDFLSRVPLWSSPHKGSFFDWYREYLGFGYYGYDMFGVNFEPPERIIFQYQPPLRVSSKFFRWKTSLLAKLQQREVVLALKDWYNNFVAVRRYRRLHQGLGNFGVWGWYFQWEDTFMLRFFKFYEYQDLLYLWYFDHVVGVFLDFILITSFIFLLVARFTLILVFSPVYLFGLFYERKRSFFILERIWGVIGFPLGLLWCVLPLELRQHWYYFQYNFVRPYVYPAWDWFVGSWIFFVLSILGRLFVVTPVEWAFRFFFQMIVFPLRYFIFEPLFAWLSSYFNFFKSSLLSPLALSRFFWEGNYYADSEYVKFFRGHRASPAFYMNFSPFNLTSSAFLFSKRRGRTKPSETTTYSPLTTGGEDFFYFSEEYYLKHFGFAQFSDSFFRRWVVYRKVSHGFWSKYFAPYRITPTNRFGSYAVAFLVLVRNFVFFFLVRPIFYWLPLLGVRLFFPTVGLLVIFFSPDPVTIWTWVLDAHIPVYSYRLSMPTVHFLGLAYFTLIPYLLFSQVRAFFRDYWLPLFTSVFNYWHVLMFGSCEPKLLAGRQLKFFYARLDAVDKFWCSIPGGGGLFPPL